MIRRVFFWHGLMLLGFSRRAWAQLTEPQYTPLADPVRIPLDGVTALFHPVSFTAEAVLPPAGAALGQRVRLDGILFRTSTRDDSPQRFSALCTICPHESCLVKFFNDPNLSAELSEGATTGPIFSCGCHRSVFDAVEGDKIIGPTHRGLYRFRVTDVTSGSVVISEVEEELLRA